jgi:hypothetical protein
VTVRPLIAAVSTLCPRDERFDAQGPGGRVVFTVDVAGVFTLVSTSGTATDICAALS